MLTIAVFNLMEYRGCRGRCPLTVGSTPTPSYFMEMKTAIPSTRRNLRLKNRIVGFER